MPGFGVRVFAFGKRSYLVQYCAGGRTRRVTIGLHGPVTCEKARKQGKELLGRVAGVRTRQIDRETLSCSWRRALGRLCRPRIAFRTSYMSSLVISVMP
jgi:Arm DNA-binding domain